MNALMYPLFSGLMACLLWMGLPQMWPSEDPGKLQVGKPSQPGLELQEVITGNIRPKSVVHSGNGLFFAQNMMYRHSITVYNRAYELLATISDAVDLSAFGYEDYGGIYQGSPVEAAFSPDGRYAWVSNYKMYGEGFEASGDDNCQPGEAFDFSFLYRIDTRDFRITDLVKVGAVPKYVAVSPDGRWVLTSNWCSGDLSIVDAATRQEVHRLGLGRYPRGIAIDAKSRYAYVSVMGDDKVAIVKLSDYSVQWIEGVGQTPRHLCLGPSGRYLYVSLSREGKVAKIDLTKREVVSTAVTGREARSMALTPEGNYLYVVNYLDNSLSKVRTRDMKLIENEPTRAKPIGVTLDASRRRVWVACYTGSLMVFEDKAYVPQTLLPEVPLAEAGPLPPSPGRRSAPSATMFSPFIPAASDRPASLDPNYYVYRPELPLASPPKREAEPALASQEKPAPAAPPVPAKEPRQEPASAAAPAERATPAPKTHARVRAIPPREDSLPVANTPSQLFYLIAGSYQDRSNALQRQRALQALGFEAQILSADQGWYRVSVQSHPSRLLAETAQRLLLQKENIDAWIYQP